MRDSKWYTDWIKRFFDLAIAVPSVIILSPPSCSCWNPGANEDRLACAFSTRAAWKKWRAFYRI